MRKLVLLAALLLALAVMGWAQSAPEVAWDHDG